MAGTALQSLGQSLSPAQFTAALKNLQDYKQKQEERNLIQEDFANLSKMAEEDKEFGKFFKRYAAQNPTFSIDNVAEYKRGREKMMNARSALNTLRAAKEQGLVPEGLESTYQEMAFLNPLEMKREVRMRMGDALDRQKKSASTRLQIEAMLPRLSEKDQADVRRLLDIPNNEGVPAAMNFATQGLARAQGLDSAIDSEEKLRAGKIETQKQMMNAEAVNRENIEVGRANKRLGRLYDNIKPEEAQKLREAVERDGPVQALSDYDALRKATMNTNQRLAYDKAKRAAEREFDEERLGTVRATIDIALEEKQISKEDHAYLKRAAAFKDADPSKILADLNTRTAATKYDAQNAKALQRATTNKNTNARNKLTLFLKDQNFSPAQIASKLAEFDENPTSDINSIIDRIMTEFRSSINQQGKSKTKGPSFSQMKNTKEFTSFVETAFLEGVGEELSLLDKDSETYTTDVTKTAIDGLVRQYNKIFGTSYENVDQIPSLNGISSAYIIKKLDEYQADANVFAERSTAASADRLATLSSETGPLKVYDVNGVDILQPLPGDKARFNPPLAPNSFDEQEMLGGAVKFDLKGDGVVVELGNLKAEVDDKMNLTFRKADGSVMTSEEAESIIGQRVFQDTASKDELKKAFEKLEAESSATMDVYANLVNTMLFEKTFGSLSGTPAKRQKLADAFVQLVGEENAKDDFDRMRLKTKKPAEGAKHQLSSFFDPVRRFFTGSRFKVEGMNEARQELRMRAFDLYKFKMKMAAIMSAR